jgi:hypothetical protein
MRLQSHPFIYFFSRVTCLLLVTGFLFCCKKKDKDPEKTAVTKKGFGDSQERPTGTPFQLPASVTINGPVKGFINWGEACENKEDKAKGKGDLVKLCIPFFNNSNQPVTITFPPGLIFIAKNVNYQNGILIEQAVFEVPPQQQFYIPIFLCCLNESRTPSVPWEEWELGPVTNDKDMLDLVTWLNTKNLTGGFTSTGTQPVQHAVWNVSEGEPIDEDDKNDIANLPNK